jgi:glucose-1-phosphate thymidylyltransferase
LLDGPVVVAFADTLFKADFKLDNSVDGILWVKQIEDPSAFGVIKMDENGAIVDFVEKPKTFVSDLAMIGIYYFKEGKDLLSEINYLLDNEVIKSGEYQLPDALRRLVEKGQTFKPGEVNEWLDCGNKEVTVYTNQRVLEFDREKGIETIDSSVSITNGIIIPPCYIGKGVVIENAVVGPHVSLGNGTKVTNSLVSNTIVQENSFINNANLKDSMIGNFAAFRGKSSDISLGDYSTID